MGLLCYARASATTPLLGDCKFALRNITYYFKTHLLTYQLAHAIQSPHVKLIVYTLEHHLLIILCGFPFVGHRQSNLK